MKLKNAEGVIRIQITPVEWLEVHAFVNANSPGGLDRSIVSNLHTGKRADRDYDRAMDGIESLVLAQACAGIDVSTKKYREALRTAVEACANNL